MCTCTGLIIRLAWNSDMRRSPKVVTKWDLPETSHSHSPAGETLCRKQNGCETFSGNNVLKIDIWTGLAQLFVFFLSHEISHIAFYFGKGLKLRRS